MCYSLNILCVCVMSCNGIFCLVICPLESENALRTVCVLRLGYAYAQYKHRSSPAWGVKQFTVRQQSYDVLSSLNRKPAWLCKSHKKVSS